MVTLSWSSHVGRVAELYNHTSTKTIEVRLYKLDKQTKSHPCGKPGHNNLITAPQNTQKILWRKRDVSPHMTVTWCELCVVICDWWAVAYQGHGVEVQTYSYISQQQNQRRIQTIQIKMGNESYNISFPLQWTPIWILAMFFGTVVPNILSVVPRLGHLQREIKIKNMSQQDKKSHTFNLGHQRVSLVINNK